MVKTHGKRGEVVTEPVHGLPLVLDVGMDVYPVPPALKGRRSYRISSCFDGPTGQRLSLQGVWSLEAADELVGKTLLVPISQLPDSFDLHDVPRLLGREVIDQTLGSLGAIDDVMQGVAQDVWVITGPFGEVMIPVVDAMIVSIEEGKPVLVDVPRGLVEEG